MARQLVWFRSDLRVRDNPALRGARDEAGPDGVVALLAICPRQWRVRHDWGDAKADFVLRAMHALADELRDKRMPLKVVVRDWFDDLPKAIVEIARSTGCAGVHCNAEYEVNERARDAKVREACADAGIEMRVHHDQTIFEPGTIRTQNDTIYTVFTPFRRSWMERLDTTGLGEPLQAPQRQQSIDVESDDVPERLDGFERRSDLDDLWPATEEEARRRLERFAERAIEGYDDDRDAPALDATSRLSPYLAAGVISQRTCAAAAIEAGGGDPSSLPDGPATWLSELVWREFYKSILVGFPRVSKRRAFKEETEEIDWRRDDEGFAAWCEGRTGYPIVDAGMRQLAKTGWMHNRLRMITASFLVKDLLVDWRRGEKHFARHLVDYDLASNNGGWQWSASTGTDAQPYFRIFNPTSQAKRYDPDGAFIREWVPELAEVDAPAIFEPGARGKANGDYAEPIIDHSQAREKALAAFKNLG